jgi:hypothetical protein
VLRLRFHQARSLLAQGGLQAAASSRHEKVSLFRRLFQGAASMLSPYAARLHPLPSVPKSVSILR